MIRQKGGSSGMENFRGDLCHRWQRVEEDEDACGFFSRWVAENLANSGGTSALVYKAATVNKSL